MYERYIKKQMDEQFSLEVLFRYNEHTPHVQPLFQIAKGLLDEVLVPVNLDSDNRIFYPIAQ